MDLGERWVVTDDVFTVVSFEESGDGLIKVVMNNYFARIEIVAFNGDSHIESAGAGTDDTVEFIELGEIDIPNPGDIATVVDMVIQDKKHVFRFMIVFDAAHDDVAASGIFTEVEGAFFAVDEKSLVTAVFAFIGGENLFNGVQIEIVKIGDSKNGEQIIDMVKIFVGGGIGFAVSLESIAREFSGNDGEFGIGEVAFFAMKMTEVRILIIIVN